jgi:hypothetical protein
MGNEFFIAKFETEKEMNEFVKFVYAKEKVKVEAKK